MLPRRSTLAKFAWLLCGTVAAQSGHGSAPATTGLRAPAGQTVATNAVDMPPPPASFVAVPPLHRMPALAATDATSPPPTDPPSRLASAAGPVRTHAPGDFRFWKHAAVVPNGASNSTVADPSIAHHDNVVVQTGNWFAAVSPNHGQSWTHVNPYTRFPATDAGFCCAQRAIHVAGHDMTVWALQYAYSAATRSGGVRIARAVGRPDLLAQRWTHWYFTPQDFGRPSGEWLDFPDVAQTTTHLWCAANMFDAIGLHTGSVVWRVPLAQLAIGSTIAFEYWRDTAIGAHSYRFATEPTSGVGSRMFLAAHVDTATVRVYAHDVATNLLHWNDRSIPSWFGLLYLTPSPDGNGIGARADGRILGGYRAGTEIGFLWNAPSRLGRPWPYVRVARFQTTDRTLIDVQDVWSPEIAFLYPAAAANARGDRAVVLQIASATTYPTTAALIVDAFAPTFAGQTVHPLTNGTAGPAASRFGDSLDVQQHPNHPQTFVGVGATQRGGSGNANVEPRYAWFSRELDQPSPVFLDVFSTPVRGIPIGIDVADLDGASNGTTDFRRSFGRRQQYELTAPLVHVVGGTTWVFRQWSGTFPQPPPGVRTVAVPDIGTTDHTATADYVPGRTLQVQSQNPAQGVAITLSVADVNGARNGTTSFPRIYRDGEIVTVTAPATFGGLPLKRWRIDGVDQPLTQLTATVTMSADRVATAVYYTLDPGALVPFGAGCAGDTGTMQSTASGTARIGFTLQCTLQQGAIRNAPVSFVVGHSRTNWGGLSLPLDLAVLGAPGCHALTDHGATLASVADSAGSATLALPLPNSLALVGRSVHLQWLAPTSRNALGLGTSNAVEVRIGGLR